jgi:hypothetical protein
MVQVRNKLNSMGLKVMLDYVPNHSDCESKPSKNKTKDPLLKSNNDYFVRAPRNLRKPYDPALYLPNGEAYGKDPISGGWM